MLGRVVNFKSENIVLKATSKVMTVTRLAVSSHTKSGGNFSTINGNLVFEGSARYTIKRFLAVPFWR